MVGEHGVIWVQAKSDAEGRSGSTYFTFEASAVLMQPSGDNVVGSVNARTFTCVNTMRSPVYAGDFTLVAKTKQGAFVTVPCGCEE